MEPPMTPFATVPLSNHLVLQSEDVREVQQRITSYFTSHNIRFLDGKSRLRTVLHRTRVGRLPLSLLTYGANVMIDPATLGFYLVHINIAGRCELTHDQGHLVMDSVTAAVCPPHRPVRFWWQPESTVIALQIPRDALEEQVRLRTGAALDTPVDFDLKMDLTTPAAERFLRLLDYVLRDADDIHGLSQSPHTSGMIEQSLIAALLASHPSSYSDRMAQDADAPAPYYVMRAERMMYANLTRPLRVAELADAGGVSERTLSEGFRRFRGHAPAAFFQMLRLSAAREQLASAPVGKTLTDIAFELGFVHLSGFAAAYRAQFGEAPSTTLRRRKGLLN
jgi:AraC-like DNA-binding protein